MSDARPNILFIMSDDHASHAMSCYGSRINRTPNLDRIAEGGMRFDNCFCTNSICTPSRAAILAGTYNHVNGVTTLDTPMDNGLITYPKLLRSAGYQTAIFGKWHLGEGAAHCPTGFDDWAVLPGQGLYHNPDFIFKGPAGGDRRTVRGYATDIITDMCLDWLDRRDRDRPFCMMCHHKAPHRRWESDEKHAHLYLNETIPEPDNLLDDYAGRASAAAAAHMRVGVHMDDLDLNAAINRKLSEPDLRKWAYQLYIKKYLRVIASIDDNVGRVLDYLDEQGLAGNTLIVYTSDQGFFLGDHGWYDKRFMYEESLRMPFILRYPREVKPRGVNADIVLNVDFAPLFLDLAGVPAPGHVQGRSFRSLLNGETPADWRQAMYYRYWMHGGEHNVCAHYGVRTLGHKLICYNPGAPGDGDVTGNEGKLEWELFDLRNDPREMDNIYGQPGTEKLAGELKALLHRLQNECGDSRYPDDID